jgi:ribosomal protein L44E
VAVVVTEGAAGGVVADVVEAAVVAVAEDFRCQGQDRANIDKAHHKRTERLKEESRRARRQNEAYGSGSAYRSRHLQKERPRFSLNGHHVRISAQARRSAFLGICIGKVQLCTNEA